MKRIYAVIIIVGMGWASVTLSRFVGEDVDQPKIGNFALPASQAPGPLVSFGQTVVNPGDFYLFCYPFVERGTKKKLDGVVLYPSWTPFKHFALTLNIPVTIKSTIDGVHAAGLNDIVLDAEYMYHFKGTERSWTSFTIFGSMSFPTGVKDFTFGSPAYFLGLTCSYLNPEWYAFTSSGFTITTCSHGTQFGNNFLYQGGFGHNFDLPFKNWIFLWMVEVDGIASQSGTIKGVEDKNSGGNIIFITPSLWISNKFTIMQFGISIPAVQHLRGNQDKLSYILNCNFGFTF